MSVLVTVKEYTHAIMEVCRLKDDQGLNIPLMVCGNHGIGKTCITEEIGKALGYSVVVLNLANQTPEDLIGIPKQDGNGFHRPSWMNTDPKVKTLYFLDEINRAPKYVLSSMFNFINEGRIHHHSILPTDVIIGASNPDSDSYDVTMFDDIAWNSRFCHLYLTPTRREFINYLTSKFSTDANGLARQSSMISALEIMEQTGVGIIDNVVALENRVVCHGDNRNIEKCFQILGSVADQSVTRLLITGLVGVEVATPILNSLKLVLEIPSAESILTLDPKSPFVFDTQNLDTVSAINSSLCVYLKTEYFSTVDGTIKLMRDKYSDITKDALGRYLLAIPNDSAVSCLSGLKSVIAPNAPLQLVATDVNLKIL